MEWTKVKEQLPEATIGEAGQPPMLTDDVLVYFEAGDRGYEIANYDYEEESWYSLVDGFFFDAEPSHWMPLPKAPL